MRNLVKLVYLANFAGYDEEVASRHVNIHEAKTQLSKLINELDEGDEVIIANRGNPVARLVPVVGSTDRRMLGQFDLGGALTDVTIAGLAPLDDDAELDEIGWPR